MATKDHFEKVFGKSKNRNFDANSYTFVQGKWRFPIGIGNEEPLLIAKVRVSEKGIYLVVVLSRP